MDAIPRILVSYHVANKTHKTATFQHAHIQSPIATMIFCCATGGPFLYFFCNSSFLFFLPSKRGEHGRWFDGTPPSPRVDDDVFLFQRLHELVHQLTISNEYGRFADGRHNLDRLSDVVRSGHLFARLEKIWNAGRGWRNGMVMIVCKQALITLHQNCQNTISIATV